VADRDVAGREAAGGDIPADRERARLGWAGRDRVRLGSALAILAAVLWGTSWVATGLALHSLSPMATAAWRGLFTAAVLLPVIVIPAVRARRSLLAPLVHLERGRFLRYLVLATLAGPAFLIGMTVAVGISGATIAAFVAGAYPVIAAAGAPLVLGERPSRVAIGGLGLAFLGALLMAGFDIGGLRLDGLLVASGSAFSFGVFLLLARRWQGPWLMPAATVTFLNFGLAGVVAALICLAGGGGPLLPTGISGESWLAIVYLAVAPGLVGTLAVLASVKRIPAASSSAFLMLNPLTAAVLAAPVLGERLTPVQLLGGALVLAGIAAATALAAWTGRASRSARAKQVESGSALL
jgi:drug/metabolite transporter (DMT)-like permease